MTRDDLFNTNASIVRDLASAVARVAPDAHILVISNPVNSTVPIVAATLEKAGVFDPKRLFGVTTLDVVRAARFVGSVANANPAETIVPVVGGHSGPTIVPLLSHLDAGKSIIKDQAAYEAIVQRIQYGGDEVVKAKDGAGSATLSMAYAGAKFTNSLLRGLNGEKNIITPTFVKSPLYEDQGVDFFSSNVELGVSTHIVVIRVFLLMCFLLAQRCREDPPPRPDEPRGAEAPRCLPAGTQEEHREGQGLRCVVVEHICYPVKAHLRTMTIISNDITSWFLCDAANINRELSR
jgi:malate/lactate dehydrogenase